VPATVWCIIETLQNPALLKHMLSEMKRHYTASKKSYDVSAIASIPVIQSMLAEIGRLRTATASIRTNVVDGFKLDDQWVIPKSWNTVVFSQDLAMNTELWTKARPSTVDRPLGEFWAERFLVSEKATRYHNIKTGTGKFSMEGIDALLTVFGGGQNACPGRGLANSIQAGTLAVLMNEYEMDLSEPDTVEEAMPSTGGVVIGVIKPIAKIRVRIRKRMTSK
jgi:cytochrome P450